MKLTIPRFDQSKVLVVGDVMLDRYWHGSTTRISPEAPVPVVKVGLIEDRPGGAANVALNIASLGVPAWLVGVTGEDEAADVLQTRLEAAGIACGFVRTALAPTITKLRVLSQNQQLIRLDHEEALHDLIDSNEVFAEAAERMDGIGAIVLSDYDKGTLQGCQRIIRQARALNIPVLVDPKGSDFERYRGATLITPNLKEFEAVVGHCATEQVLIEKGKQLLAELELEALLITRSENGMTLIQQDAANQTTSELHFPARAREVFDVTGAGDTVISVLATALAAQCSLAEAAGLANIAAGIVVGKVGTATVSLPELRQKVQQSPEAIRGAVSQEQLLLAVEEARANGQRIVFTNGCFDILHAGHVGYLEQARRQGDRLVLAINDDASVTRLKGEGRPINPVDRRMTVLAGLAAVDWVVSFSENTPENLITAIKPNILVKGGDYSLDEVVGAPIVHAYGGEVKVLSFLDNCSTTAIVEKIRDKETV